MLYWRLGVAAGHLAMDARFTARSAADLQALARWVVEQGEVFWEQALADPSPLPATPPAPPVGLIRIAREAYEAREGAPIPEQEPIARALPAVADEDDPEMADILIHEVGGWAVSQGARSTTRSAPPPR